MAPKKHTRNQAGRRIASANLRLGTHVEQIEFRTSEIDTDDTEPDPAIAQKIDVIPEITGEVLMTYTVGNLNKEAALVTVDSETPEHVTGAMLRATAQIAIGGAGGNIFDAKYKQEGSKIPMNQIVDAGLAPPEAA